LQKRLAYLSYPAVLGTTPRSLKISNDRVLPVAKQYPVGSRFDFGSISIRVPLLIFVIDVFDKELIGHHFGFRCRKEDAIESLKMAVLSRFPSGEIPDNFRLTLRLDRGCQFTAFDFAKSAKIFNIEIEFCDAQAPNQKPFIESFFSNFKREEVYRNFYQNPAQAISAWFAYCDWYNNLRPHAALNYLSPAQFRRVNFSKYSSSGRFFVQFYRGFTV